MTAETLRSLKETSRAAGSPWRHVVEAAAALAAGMGVGRFVYTPILPLMHAQAGLSTNTGAALATANYVGYLAGAIAGIAAPRLIRVPAVLRLCLIALTVSLAAMATTENASAWLGLRLVAGFVSALIFVTAVNSLLDSLRDHPAHLPGWAFGGIGAGIALSGALVLAVRSVGDWRTAWSVSAALSGLFSAAAWNLRTEAPKAPPTTEQRPPVPARRWFVALFASYSLEGVGYIVAGTFLVAAIEQNSPGSLGSAAWVVVGLAAVPSSAFWAWLARRWSRPDTLLAALAIQAIGIALPALVPGTAAALISACLFGATFLGIATVALATGTHLRFPRAVALLTTGYSVGQIVGPLMVAPLIQHGYHRALIVAAAVVLAAAFAAGVLRIGFPVDD